MQETENSRELKRAVEGKIGKGIGLLKYSFPYQQRGNKTSHVDPVLQQNLAILVTRNFRGEKIKLDFILNVTILDLKLTKTDRYLADLVIMSIY